jgi:hypothetical protein
MFIFGFNAENFMKIRQGMTSGECGKYVHKLQSILLLKVKISRKSDKE